MELDELKVQLRQKLDEAPISKSELDISAMLKKNAGSVVHKLKRSLWIEIIFCIFCTLAFCYVGIFSSHWSFQVYFSTFSIVCLVFLIVLFYLMTKINRLGSSTLPIKNNLQLIHSIIKEYTKRNFQFTMGLIPICMIFSLWLGYKDSSSKVHFSDSILSQHLKSPTQIYIFLTVYILSLTIGAYYLTKYYLRKLYGNYLIKLQGFINELDEEK